MNDSDDYFSDDLVLDDQTLAVLDQEESKFKCNVSNQRTLPDVSPPTKRQRTTASRSPANFIYRTDTSDDMDDLPDISIRTDGSYGLQDRQGPGPSRRAQVVSGPPALAQAGPGPTSAASLSRGPATRGRSVAGPVKVVQQPPRPPSSTRATRVPPSPVMSQGIARSQSGPRANGNTIQAASDAYVAALLRQVEELRKKNDTMQAEMQKSHTELQAALDAKFAKEGEVTHLRKRMEKTAQDHLAQLARLKAAKEEADAKQILLQKQYEVDRERLRTEYVFKQHELEISTRKPPGSVRSKRTTRDILPTPVPISSQMQARKQTGIATGHRTPVPESPRRPRFGAILDHDWTKRHPPPVDSCNLPSGFRTNALHSQIIDSDKGKGKAITRSPPEVGCHSQSSSRNLPADVFVAQVDDHIGMDVFASPTEVGVANGDVIMVDGTNPVTVDSDEIEEVEPLNWNLILHHAILMHLDKESQVSTLQLLMCASLSDEGQAKLYGHELSQILNILASIPNDPVQNFVQNATVISQAFCEIAGLLASNSLVSPLTALLCLLAHLTYTIPSFHGPLLSLLKSEQDNTSHLLSTLCGILEDLQTFEKASDQHVLDSLKRQALSLLEALTWNISVESEKSLELIPCSPTVLNALFQPSHPRWFLVDSTRLLMLLSTRPSLFHSLLPFPGSEHTKQDGKLSDLIDLMCALLADVDRTEPEVNEIKTNIITFFGMLSNVHPYTFTPLVESQALIPSVVIHLTNLVASIWGDNVPIVSGTQAISRAVRMISQATLLMDRLVTSGESFSNLRERLYRAPTWQYNGVVHMFIRTFGRLSFLDPPDWVNGQDRQQLEQVADLAKTLLELVVEGPEAECIWETYEGEAVENGEAQTEADDEEVEARRLELESI